MSSKKRRIEIRKIRNSYPTKTLKELEDEGLVPKNFHLFDRVDMKEYQLKHKTDWWKQMITNQGVGVFSCKPIQTCPLGLKMGGLYVDVRFLQLVDNLPIIKITKNKRYMRLSDLNRYLNTKRVNQPQEITQELQPDFQWNNIWSKK